MNGQYISIPSGGGGGGGVAGVSSLNSLTGAVTVSAGAGISLAGSSGNNIQVSSTIPAPTVFTLTTTDGKPVNQSIYTIPANQTVLPTIEIVARTTAGTTPTAAKFVGSIDGVTTPVTVSAIYGGPVGNSIQILFDGIMTINQAIAAWTAAFPYAPAVLSAGDGTQIPNTPATKSSYTGTPGGCSTPVTVTNNYGGTFSFTLTGDGSSTINELIAASNMLAGTYFSTYYSTVSLTSGDGTQVPSAGDMSIVTTGGTGADAITALTGGVGYDPSDSASWASGALGANVPVYLNVLGYAVSTNGVAAATMAPTSFYGNGTFWKTIPGFVTNQDNNIYVQVVGQEGFTIDWEISVTFAKD
jgi:hypothetical protein